MGTVVYGNNITTLSSVDSGGNNTRCKNTIDALCIEIHKRTWRALPVYLCAVQYSITL